MHRSNLLIYYDFIVLAVTEVLVQTHKTSSRLLHTHLKHLNSLLNVLCTASYQSPCALDSQTMSQTSACSKSKLWSEYDWLRWRLLFCVCFRAESTVCLSWRCVWTTTGVQQSSHTSNAEVTSATNAKTCPHHLDLSI